MKLWAVLGILVAGLVSGCDTEEPNPGGVLSLDRNRGEAPAGVTIQDVDIIKDGFIDIKDLFAVVHFYEQKVPEGEADVVAEASNTADENAPCRNLESRFPEMEHVTDNSNYRQIFELEGKKYVYAVLGLQKMWMNFNAAPISIQKKYLFPSCVAVRFLLNGNLIPIGVKVKPVAGNDFSEPIISPKLETANNFQTPLGYNKDTEHIIHTLHTSAKPLATAKPLWMIHVHKDYDFNYTPPHRGGELDKESDRLRKKIGIPIGDNGVIVEFQMKQPNARYTGMRRWLITTRSPIFNDPFYGASPRNVSGVYVNMSPTEVRQRYFPEDL